MNNLLQKLYNENKTNFLEYVNKRNFTDYGYKTADEFLRKITPDGDYENTLWENGFLEGVKECIGFVEKQEKFLFEDDEESIMLVEGVDKDTFIEKYDYLSKLYIKNDLDYSGFYNELTNTFLNNINIKKLNYYKH